MSVLKQVALACFVCPRRSSSWRASRPRRPTSQTAGCRRLLPVGHVELAQDATQPPTQVDPTPRPKTRRSRTNREAEEEETPAVFTEAFLDHPAH